MFTGTRWRGAPRRQLPQSLLQQGRRGLPEGPTRMFPDITPHEPASAGAIVKALQRMLGQAKASMALDVYADLFDDDLDAVAE